MVQDIKIAHFDPGSDGICPVGCLSQIFFEKITIYGIFGPCLENVYIYLTKRGCQKASTSGSSLTKRGCQKANAMLLDTISAYSKALWCMYRRDSIPLGY